MLPRRYRLRERAAFERARLQGRQWRHPLLTMTVVANGLPHNRYGFIVTRRLGGAVRRNRIRRILREAVRRAAPDLRSGVDVVFIARDRAADASYHTIAQTLDSLFCRAQLWQKRQTEDAEHEIPGDGTDPIV